MSCQPKTSDASPRGIIISPLDFFLVIAGSLATGIVLALIATNALPRALSETMSGMMERMSAGMRAGGLKPQRMCREMMEQFAREHKN
ncbi:MAG: hypothetical protein GF331_01655 [Chitinivibrionales bacterium]|nr:hypothetical protein [Chitinivibrionales bacterium]